jgi:phage gp37-like protein
MKNERHSHPRHGARHAQKLEADSSVTRRDFMRGTVGAALGVGVACRTAAEPQSVGGASSRVVVVRDASVMNAERAVDESVLRRMLGDLVMRATGRPTAAEAWRTLVRPQDTVGLVTTGHLNPTHDELVGSVRAAVNGAGVPADKIRMAQGGPEAVKPCTALISLPALKTH